MKTRVLQFKSGSGSALATALELNRITVPFQVKADDVDKNARTFSGHAAVWDLDLGDDVIAKGAFKGTLARWKKSKDAIPLLNSHDHFDVFSALGQLLEAEEDKDGLWTKWEVIDGPDGDAVLARLRPSGRTGRAVVSKMSIGYEPLKFEFEQSDTARFGQIRHLKEVELKETSLVLFPMAPGARIDVTSVKSFLDRAVATDPKDVGSEAKVELRRLATRIGQLLSGKKTDTSVPPEVPPPPADPATPPVADPVTPPVEPPTPPAPAAPPTPDTTDDTSDTAEDEPVDPPPTPETEEKEYQFSGALQERLRKTLLQETVSTTLHK